MTKEEVLKRLREDVQIEIDDLRANKWGIKERRPEYYEGMETALVRMRSLVNRPFLDE